MATETTDPLIDPEHLESLLARVGQTTTVRAVPYLTEATRDAARHWAQALGDMNPLWSDAEYARRWGYKDILAPPTMLYAFDKQSIGYRGGLPGVHSFFAGTNWTWQRPIERNAAISAAVVFKGLIEHKSTFAEVSYRQISDVTYHDEDGNHIASAEPWAMRVSRRAARDREGSRPVEIATYTPPEIEAIAAEYSRESVQTEPRDPGSVELGEQLPSLIRGPYTVTNGIAFEQAWGGLFVQVHSEWFDYIRRHPAAGLLNEQGIPEPPEAVHWDRDFARRAGVPQPFDYGPERIAWLGVLVTNWMGPHGFLRKLNIELRKFNLVGDLTRLHGSVTAVEPAPDGGRIVSITLEARNQRDERTAWGEAEVLLATGAITEA